MDEALLSIMSVGRGQLVKMLISLKPHGIQMYLDQILYTYSF